MPRLVNERTGVVIVVDDAMAASLGPEWLSSDHKSESKPAPKRAAVKK